MCWVLCFSSFILGFRWLLTATRATHTCPQFTSRNPCLLISLTWCIVFALTTHFCPVPKVSVKPNKNWPYLWVKANTFKQNEIHYEIDKSVAHFLIVTVKLLFFKGGWISGLEFQIQAREPPHPHLALSSPTFPTCSGRAFFKIFKV